MPLQIENKFNIGDKVYFMDSNYNSFERKELTLVIVQCVVCSIEVNVEEGDVTIRYWLSPLGEGSQEIPQGGAYYEESHITKDINEVYEFVQDFTRVFMEGIK